MALKCTAAFTLIEVLIVVTIIAIIVAISSISLNQTMQAMRLTNAGNKVTQLVEVARQRAMSANSQTALILVKYVPGGDIENASGRAFTVMERRSGEEWKAIREWETLPDGIVVDIGAATEVNTFVNNSPSGLPGGGDMPAFRGQTNYEYAMRIFMPVGGLSNPNESARLQLVEGQVMGGGVQYANKAPDGLPANYYRISLLGTTGKTKVDRP